MLPLKLLLHILTAAAAVLVVALDYAYRDRRTKHFRQLRAVLWGAMGAGLLLGVIVITADEYTKRYELDGLSTQLRVLRSAAEQTAGAITGGDSFPYLNVLSDGSVVLINEGKNPLYDISVRMWDPSDYASVKESADFWALESRAFHFHTASMAPKSTLIAGRIPLPKPVAKTLEVDLIARNGSSMNRSG